MGRNLTNENINESFQDLVQISGSILTDGLGNEIENINVSASFADSALNAENAQTAVSASFAENANEATTALTATSASFAQNSATSDFATSASQADNATTANNALTADFATSASQADNANSALSASFAETATSASFAQTASFALNVPVIDTGSFLTTGSVLDDTLEFTKADSSTFNLTVNNVQNAVSSSFADNALSASFADTATSASFAQNANEATTALTATSASFAQTAALADFATEAQDSQTSKDVIKLVRNTSGIVLPVGTPVKIVGATGANPNVIVANATSDGIPNRANGDKNIIFGITTGQINNNAVGTILLTGTLVNYDTRAFSLGDFLFVAETGTSLTNISPASPTYQICVGLVTKVAEDGEVCVNVVEPIHLNDIVGINLNRASLADKQMIIFNGTEFINRLLEKSDITGLEATLDSLVKTGSVSDDTLTFTKEDNSTFDLTVNNVQNAVSASFANTATSASFADLATSASFAQNANEATTALTATSASFAQTASFALNVVDPFPFTGSAEISGSLEVDGPILRKENGFSGSVIDNITDTFPDPKVNHVVTLTQAEFDNLPQPVDSNTFFVITDAPSFVESASFADFATSASFADTSTSASFAQTASFALNVPTIDTGSFMVTGSVSDDTLTFTKADNSTFDLTVNNVQNSVSASFADNALSASFATTSNTAVSASFADNALSASFADFATSASFAENSNEATTALTATSASFAQTASFALNADVDPFPFTGSAEISGSLKVDGDTTSTFFGKIEQEFIFGNGEVDPNTTNIGIGPPGSDNIEKVIVQPDGKILLGGGLRDFNNTFGGFNNRVIRLNTDYTVDTTFNPTFNSLVTDFDLQPDGKIVVVGNFTTVNGVTTRRLCRLNSDGTLDNTFTLYPTFSDGLGGNGTSVKVLKDGGILVSHDSNLYEGVTVGRLIKLTSDGSALDSSFTTNLTNNTIFSNKIFQNPNTDEVFISFPNSTVTYDGITNRSNFIINPVDGKAIADIDNNAGNNVIGFQPDGKIMMVGNFTSVLGQSVTRGLVRLNSDITLDTSFNSSVATNSGRGIIITNDSKYIVGSNDGIRRFLNDGTLDTTFDQGTGFGAGTPIRDIAEGKDKKIIVVGAFTSYDGQSFNKFVALDSEEQEIITELPTLGANEFDGNQIVTGSVEATNGFIGDLTGTASFATVSGTTVSASFADNATSASFADLATSASFAENSNTSTTALTATSASFADFSLSSSFADFATSASFADFATNASNADLADNATSADVAISASFADFATSASFADFATSASFADFAASASFSDTSSEALSVSNAALPNNITVGGVLLGNVENITQAATASLDFGTANFFQIELNENDDTLIDITGIKAGLTVNVEVTTKPNSTVSFPASVKQSQSYVPTDANGIDILTFIAFDDTTVYLSTIKSLD